MNSLLTVAASIFRVSMVREKSEKIRFYSTSGKSQGFFLNQGICNPCSKSVKSRGSFSHPKVATNYFIVSDII